jgi:3'-phosphoadenosine 5'-phosphosulfate sulfotransferase
MNWIKSIWARIRLEIRYRKKLKELRKRDPFIYK